MPSTALTDEQARRIVREAIAQGWASEEGWEIERRNDGLVERINLGDDYGWLVKLRVPGLLGPEYEVRSTDEWRRVSAKFAELRQILQEAAERGWDMEQRIHRTGTFAMAVEIYPPGYRRPYGVRVGGMRTWRKVCREADAIIEQRHDRALEEGPEP